MLKDAHDAAEKAKEDLMKKSKDSEVFYFWLKAVVIFNLLNSFLYLLYVCMYIWMKIMNITLLQ